MVIIGLLDGWKVGHGNPVANGAGSGSGTGAYDVGAVGVPPLSSLQNRSKCVLCSVSLTE
jgi:hypothetical protein